MAIFRRSHASSKESKSGSNDDSYVDPPTRASADSAALAQSDAPSQLPRSRRSSAAATSEDFTADANDLLPDVRVSARERNREQRLVEAACRGENSAIEALYRTHFDTIYRYVFLRVGSPSGAEDVTSQVFLGMVKGLPRYRDQGKPFVAWLYGIAQKQIAFYQRGQSRAPSPVDLDAAKELVADSAGPDATTEQRELRVAVAEALRKVPDGQREVIMMRYILSLSLAETAAAIGRTEGAVKQLQLRGLATLRNILGQEGLDLR